MCERRASGKALICKGLRLRQDDVLALGSQTRWIPRQYSESAACGFRFGRSSRAGRERDNLPNAVFQLVFVLQFQIVRGHVAAPEQGAGIAV